MKQSEEELSILNIEMHGIFRFEDNLVFFILLSRFRTQCLPYYSSGKKFKVLKTKSLRTVRSLKLWSLTVWSDTFKVKFPLCHWEMKGFGQVISFLHIYKIRREIIGTVIGKKLLVQLNEDMLRRPPSVDQAQSKLPMTIPLFSLRRFSLQCYDQRSQYIITAAAGKNKSMNLSYKSLFWIRHLQFKINWQSHIATNRSLELRVLMTWYWQARSGDEGR